MGWKGALRSMAAASRAAQRDAQRRHKQLEKARMTSTAAEAVEDWEDYINNLIHVHTNTIEPIDWHALANRPGPTEPAFSGLARHQAEAKLNAFKPGFLDFFQGGSDKIRRRLEAAVTTATVNDEAAYEAARVEHAKAFADWEEDRNLASSLLHGEAEAIREVLETQTSLTPDSLIASAIMCSVERGHVHARLQVRGEDIVPNMRRKQLASGRLSESKMPVGQFNEIYQDYVCSVALKTGNDLFCILPVDDVYVTCLANMLNPQTGHHDWTPILSVQFVREGISKLNMSLIDPSDAMRNFRHRMEFSKSKGLSWVAPLPFV